MSTETSAPDAMQQSDSPAAKAPQYYAIKYLHSSESQICRWKSSISLDLDEMVICPSRYGKDLGRILGPVCQRRIPKDEEVSDILRIATESDLARYEENKGKEREALDQCREKINQRGLEMKLVSAHYLLDESKLLFFFTADERVDFRQLVKDLVSVFRVRIELRQIGVRDESRVLGGVAVCGRAYCCHGLTDKLRPVSIKMAKEQNLSLNSMKISGPCGRLLCCLSYEYDFYREEKGRLPDVGSRVLFSGTFYRISEVNILSKKIKLSAQDGRVRDLHFCRFEYDKEKKSWSVSGDDEEE